MRRLLPYLLVVVVLGAGALLLAGLDRSDGSDPLTGTWSLQHPKDSRTPKGAAADVSCTRSTWCVTVSNDPDSEGGRAELWNGSRPKMIGRFDSKTKAVACPTPGWCIVIAEVPGRSWIIERGGSPTGAERWEKKANSPPSPKGANELILNDVSCLSKTACTVVGIDHRQGYEPYVAHWNGHGWTTESAVSGSAGLSHGMLGVSCPTESFCVAAGSYLWKPFMEHWDGSRWRIERAPHPDGVTEANVTAVSCVSPAWCMAVGDIRERSERVKPFALRWQDGRWSLVQVPAPARGDDVRLHSVSCFSPNSCVAVGTSAFASAEVPKELTVGMGWNGSEWGALRTLDPSRFNSLEAVSCAGEAACTVVGWTGPSSIAEEHGDSTPLVERFG